MAHPHGAARLSSHSRRSPGAALGVVRLCALASSVALAVSVTVPANAIAPSAAAWATVPAPLPGNGPLAQSLEVASVDPGSVARDGYTVTDPPPPPPKADPRPATPFQAARIYSSTGTGAVRWPFPYAVRISDAFGYRVSPCAGCSSDHKGTDFDAGNGAPIFAIADGVVAVSEASGGYGTHVYIDHVVNGQNVRSLYAHMQAGSSPLVAGQQVRVGDFVGLVGATGAVTGAHLHHEILVNGVNVDPFAWLQANAG